MRHKVNVLFLCSALTCTNVENCLSKPVVDDDFSAEEAVSDVSYHRGILDYHETQQCWFDELVLV